MGVFYNYFNKKCKIDVDSNNTFILTNQSGNFAMFGINSSISKYCGLFRLKKINEIYYDYIKSFSGLKCNDKILNYGKSGNEFVIEYDNCRVESRLIDDFFFSMINYKNNKNKKEMEDNECREKKEEENSFTVQLDTRFINESPTFGRSYSYEIIKRKKHTDVIVKYNCNDFEYYNIFRIVGKDINIEKVDSWEKVDNYFDKERNDFGECYVYNAFKIITDNDFLFFEYGNEKYETCEIKLDMFCNYVDDKLYKDDNDLKLKIKEFEKLKIYDENEKSAFIESDLNSYNLIIDNFEYFGLRAGVPWFYHVWTRDELISLGKFIKTSDNLFVKRVLNKYLDCFNENGCLPNRLPHSDLASADGTGWFYKRLHDFLEHLDEKNKLFYIYSKKELKEIYDRLKIEFDKYCRNKIKDNFVFNEALETWMDTSCKNDIRDGFRVEIQALFSSMYKCLIKLANINEDNYSNILTKRYDLFIQYFRKTFVNENKVVDGMFFDKRLDLTVRPNVFLAYYINSDLVSDDVWINTFNNALASCYLNWGGLSSISKYDNLFLPNYTGMTNESYHRGDSWYFVNNIAAICMIDLDKKTGTNNFSKYYNDIIQASTDGILKYGTVGYLAEVSSASKREDKGCLGQTWSICTYVELIKKKYNLKI